MYLRSGNFITVFYTIGGYIDIIYFGPEYYKGSGISAKQIPEYSDIFKVESQILEFTLNESAEFESLMPRHKDFGKQVRGSYMQAFISLSVLQAKCTPNHIEKEGPLYLLWWVEEYLLPIYTEEWSRARGLRKSSYLHKVLRKRNQQGWEQGIASL